MKEIFFHKYVCIWAKRERNGIFYARSRNRKKYKVIKLPKDIEKYKKIEIEQSYLQYYSKSILRIRKYNEDKYILSYKARKKEYKEDLNVSDEVEIPLSQDAYEH